MKTYSFNLTPKGNCDALYFPFDMLRYDRCWPATPEAAKLIEDCDCRTKKMKLIDNKTVIEMKGQQQPTSARWESQGWGVIDCRRS